MDSRLPPSLADSVTSASDWWREAGVDFAYSDEPRAWLAGPSRANERPEAEATPREANPAVSSLSQPRSPAGGDRESWPKDLATFRTWWLAEPTLDQGGTNPRIAPRGQAGASLMILVPMPEEGDRDALLQGPHGRLLASLVGAVGLASDSVYFATALPRHVPLPGWADLAASCYGEVLRHHIGLVDPARLIILGRDVLPLLGHDPAQAAPFINQIAIQGRQLPIMASYAPERLLGNARWRSQLWRCWLDWTEGNVD